MSEDNNARGQPTLAGRLRAGEKLVSAWSGLPDPLVAETLARLGFDAVTLDMQHGFHSTESVLRGIAGAALAGKPAIVRIPVGRFDMASRALDMGAAAVIAPMINDVDDARAFAAATKFPPLGERSWGPHRAMQLSRHGDVSTFMRTADGETLSFAMIETRKAFDRLNDILDVDGIDGVFVGPADFSIAWSEGAKVDPRLEEMMPAIEAIAAAADRSGKLAAIYAADPGLAGRYRQMGYRLVATASDTESLVLGAATLLERAKAE
ncbi:aldolase/citrate lyase family protein [Afifella sp. H1R]|uniref:HpcH/HpaI aldolase family protein n=1 Tax=Afifella sp. H1R TaxID=2908841 RepID=UPI001F19A98F|nr:aldolase/citrate lyase family protein [Afifella sp. H1R]MCF1503273.1 aldolase/citrate lyase family protein [Afifella sp. H1R]